MFEHQGRTETTLEEGQGPFDVSLLYTYIRYLVSYAMSILLYRAPSGISEFLWHPKRYIMVTWELDILTSKSSG